MHDTQGGRQGQSDTRVTKSEFLEQESVISEHAGGLFRTREWRGRISLESVGVNFLNIFLV